MAKIEVTGAIRRVFFDGKGAALAESYKTKDGTTKTREYTLWFNAPHGLDIGDFATVTGTLTANIEDWQNQDGSPKLDSTGKQGRSVRLAVNGAEIAERLTPKTETAALTDDFPF